MEGTEAVTLKYVSIHNRGINDCLFTSLVYASGGNPKPKGQNNRDHFLSLHWWGKQIYLAPYIAL